MIGGSRPCGCLEPFRAYGVLLTILRLSLPFLAREPVLLHELPEGYFVRTPVRPVLHEAEGDIYVRGLTIVARILRIDVQPATSGVPLGCVHETAYLKGIEPIDVIEGYVEMTDALGVQAKEDVLLERGIEITLGVQVHVMKIGIGEHCGLERFHLDRPRSKLLHERSHHLKTALSR